VNPTPDSTNMNDKKQIFGWLMYDWANSAFVTTVAVGLLPIYFVRVVFGDVETYSFGLFELKPTTIWAFTLSAVAVIVFIIAPILGAIADFSNSKKKFLMIFCYGGSLFGILLYFCSAGDVWQTIVFFFFAQTGLVGSMVFYDAFLPHIATDDTIDWISGKGYAYGYIGGGTQFALSIGLVAGSDFLGIEKDYAVRLAMTMASLWWGGFALFTYFYLKEPVSHNTIPDDFREMNPIAAYIRMGIGRTLATAKKVKIYKHLVLFLSAFLIYNNGIQTVIYTTTLYGKEELELTDSALMTALLIIQIFALPGALLFSKIAEKISAKKSLMITLSLWSALVIYAYFIDSASEFLVLSGIGGLILGGSQSLSRSLYGSMIPVNASAEFYGFYSIFSKFSSIWGLLVYGTIGELYSLRTAILSLIVFFVAGSILLSFVNVEKAKMAKKSQLFQ